jgi:hypothetical protein
MGGFISIWSFSAGLYYVTEAGKIVLIRGEEGDFATFG